MLQVIALEKFPVRLLGMEILNAPKQLHKAPPGICLVVATSLQQGVQELAPSQQLCDEVHLHRHNISLRRL